MIALERGRVWNLPLLRFSQHSGGGVVQNVVDAIPPIFFAADAMFVIIALPERGAGGAAHTMEPNNGARSFVQIVTNQAPWSYAKPGMRVGFRSDTFTSL